jgi:hypothetical protein
MKPFLLSILTLLVTTYYAAGQIYYECNANSTAIVAGVAGIFGFTLTKPGCNTVKTLRVALISNIVQFYENTVDSL